MNGENIYLTTKICWRVGPCDAVNRQLQFDLT